jgi:hypothetical protein
MGHTLRALFATLSLGLLTCGNAGSSDEQAQRAYLGIDASIDKAIQLGFDGFNAASSANLPAQKAVGTVGGTLTITGQVDQGASANKGMRLQAEYLAYSDDGTIFYAGTAGSGTELGMSLKGYTSLDGSLAGTLVKTLMMSGDLSGSVTLNLAFTGTTEYDSSTHIVSRKLGTTHIIGTVTSGDGVYQVDLIR